MYLRYSSSVVAPTVRSSPRASIGLSMFDASTEPSAAPAPTIVWSSSMNKMIWPCESVTSFKNAFSRSSNSPRQLGQVARIFLERLIFAFGILVGHALGTAHLLQRLH